MVRHIFATGLLAAGLVTLTVTGAVLAQDTRTAAEGRENGMAWRAQTVTATVNELMPDSGMVILEDAQGEKWAVRVDETVDLEDFQVGDRVRVEYYEAQAVELREPKPADRRQPLVMEKETEAPEGVNPKAGELREIRALVQVVNINQDDSTITVQGPLGRYFVLNVTDPAMLDGVNEGDEWVVIFREGVAVTMVKQ